MPNGTNIVRVPKVGHLDIQLFQDPAEAKRVNSSYTPGGYQWMHHCNGGANHVYLSPDEHQTLLVSGALAGDTVRLTRMRRGDTSYLEVQRLSDAQEPAPPAPIRSVAPASALQNETPPLARPAAQTLASALYSAVDAVLAAETYARDKGRALTFSEESVRAMALSVYISASREAR